ncbi:Thioredoxin/Endoplasmic reticulum protein ERp29, C-terminal domain containing protein, putative [Leishmania lindenbergi]|uniref:protein disulfide-isomerase n=1 Tax=Leishmania lindenbergi TaxID=651832 RepID=A0AAW3A923_9TRYP
MNRQLSVLLVLVLVGFVAAASLDNVNLSVEIPGVVQMNGENFDQLVGKDRAALVVFYTPLCMRSRVMVPEYTELGAAYKKSNNANDLLVIGKVDGTVEVELRERFNIVDSPAVLFFAPGSLEPVRYSKSLNSYSFITYLSKEVKNLRLFMVKEPQFETELEHINFDSVINDPSRAVFVMFYLPWTPENKKLMLIYNDLAKVFLGDKDVVIARIDVSDVSSKYLIKYNILETPSVYFFPKGASAKPVKYRRRHHLEGLVAFVNKRAGKNRLVNGDISRDYGVIDKLSEAAARVVKSGESVHAAIEAVKVTAAKWMEGGAGAYYITVTERLAVRGAVYVENELARLQRTLQGTMAANCRDEVVKRVNILTSIQQYIEQQAT